MSNTGHVYHDERSIGDLPGWLDKLGFKPSAAWIYVERLDAIELLPWSVEFDPTNWKHGRVFDSRLEARWTLREDGQAETWRLTESLDLLHGRFEQYDAGLPYGIYLWGRHLSRLERPDLVQKPADGQEVWVEARMPRLLAYPVQGKPEFVEARALDYCRAGRPIWTRWLSVGAASKPGDEEASND